MNSVFFRGVTARDLPAGVIGSTFRLPIRGHDTPGVLVLEDRADEVARALGLDLAGASTSVYDGIIIAPARRRAEYAAEMTNEVIDAAGVPVGDNPGEPKVVFGYYEPRTSSKMEKMRSVTLKVLGGLGRPIHLSRPNLQYRTNTPLIPARAQQIAIILGAGELDPRGFRAGVNDILGAPIDRATLSLLLPVCEGDVLRDVRGTPYAQIEQRGNNEVRVWVLVNVGDITNRPELDLYGRILTEVAAWLTLSVDERAAREADLRVAALPVARETFLAACAARQAGRVTAAQESAERETRRAEELQAALHRAILAARGFELEVPRLKEMESDSIARAMRELDKILSFKKVVTFLATPDGDLQVYTDVLTCVNPRTNAVHLIGRFRIELGILDFKVRWFNLDRTVKSFDGRQMQAPHVFFSGNACLGNTTETFPALLGDGEYAAAVQLAIQFVEEVNLDDAAGRGIAFWPLVGEQGAVPGAEVPPEDEDDGDEDDGDEDDGDANDPDDDD